MHPFQGYLSVIILIFKAVIVLSFVQKFVCVNKFLCRYDANFKAMSFSVGVAFFDSTVASILGSIL